MTLKIYNTLTKRKEEFHPIRQGHIGIYVCGITAYDVCHIGHARSAVVFDVIARYFKFKGYNVLSVKNFTDVDDKIIARANSRRTSIYEISSQYIAEHNRDMDDLGIGRPSHTPRATEYINEMIALIEVLLEKGLAYVVDGDVYYAVEAFKAYGKLSGRNLADMVAGARVDIDARKNNPLDFALWKASKEGEPWWESPWGKGRPGWHIECSVMSQKLLGDTFDIHGGGEDLIFPHHENEIAQSEGANGKPLARYWIHNGFIRINSEKMSKSLGNVFTIREVLKRYHPEVLRFFFLQGHYRSPLDFSEESLAEARAGMERFYSLLKRIDGLLKSNVTANGSFAKQQELSDKISALPAKFAEAMDDDFNTAKALGHIFDLVRLINSTVGVEGYRPTPDVIDILETARKHIKETGEVLGLFREDPDEYFQKDRNREALKLGLDVVEIEQLIAERVRARTAKDWQKADEIRVSLAQKRILLMDLPTGTTWRIQ